MKWKCLQLFSALLGLVLFMTAIWVLHQELRGYRYDDVALQIGDLRTSRLLFALGLTILDYVVMTGYDTLILRYIQYPLAYGRIALASFIGSTLSNSIGLSLLTSAPVRYRLYSAWGLSVREVAGLVAFNGMSFWLGVFAVGGVVFLLEPLPTTTLLYLPFASIRSLGAALLIVVGGYVCSSTWRRTPLQIWDVQIALPAPPLVLAQISLACLDWILAASVLYVLLPSTATVGFRRLLAIFLLAHLAGALSLLPGGIGVFETVMLSLLSPLFSAPSIVAALLAYRGIYYLLPLGVATALLGSYELCHRPNRWPSSPVSMMADVQRNDR
ncbi:MAG: UPF0104 family protein [Candidatus Methylomirabilis oxyfera]|nr:UPF0104 family protein [Candidatus Methylomirabilis oxyfera]